MAFFDRPIIAHIQILVHKVWGPEQEFQRCFADGLNKSLVSYVARQAKSQSQSQDRDITFD